MPSTPRTTHKPQPKEVDHPSGPSNPHLSHEPPHGDTPEHPSPVPLNKLVERRKRNEKKGNRGWSREGMQKAH